MYNLIIVDDEISIRQGIANSIPWNDWGFQVTGTCGNGVEALELIKKDRPDIVLSDISMPEMDGVDLMQILYKEYPEIKLIILTGYNDVEYLNMSIKSGVVEYLLKPTDIVEFKETFDKMKIRLDREKEKVNVFNEAKEYQYSNFVDTLIKGYTPPVNEMLLLGNLEKEYGISLECCQLMIIYIDKSYEYEKEMLYNIKFSVVKACNQLNMEIASQFYLNFEENIVGIFTIQTESEHERNSSLTAWIKKIQYYINEVFHISVSVGIGKECTDYRGIPEGYKQAKESVYLRVFQETEKIIFYKVHECKSGKADIASFPVDLIKKYTLFNQQEEIKEELNKIFSSLAGHYVMDNNQINYACIELISQLSVWSIEYHVSLERVMKKSRIEYVNFFQTKCLEEKYHLLQKVLLGLGSEMENSKKENRKIKKAASLVRKYVDEEFMNNRISLEYLAAKVRKNPSYVSKLFKSEMGCNFSDYVTHKRLVMSRELLKDPTVRIYEIAEQVGYADASNFIKVFKKNYGISPNEYREAFGGNSSEAVGE